MDLAKIYTNDASDWGMQGFGFYSGGFSDTQVAYYKNSPNVTVGLYKNNENTYAFVNGKATDISQLPSGVVNYSVTSITPNYFSTAKTIITADFANKTVKGTLSSGIYIDAKINGNKFASENGNMTKVKGGFFGEQAKEIGGIFKTGNSVGAFGGER